MSHQQTTPPRTILELLSDESKWTKGAFARKADGGKCWPHAPSATCWCLLGAASRVYGWDAQKHWSVLIAIDYALRSKGVPLTGTDFNDDPKTTFADIIAVVKEAGV